MRLWVWQVSVYAWFIYLVIAMNAGSQSEAMLSTPLLSLYDAAPSTMWILLGDLVLLQLLHRTFNMNKEKENGDGISFK